jgi:hypothetical protein
MNHYRFLQVEWRGDVCCVRLRKPRLEESEIYALSDELAALCTEHHSCKLALSLGPVPPDCLYSVFLAKLMTVQRVLREHNGDLVLCDVNPQVRATFEAVHLAQEFTFVADFNAAVAHWAKA